MGVPDTSAAAAAADEVSCHGNVPDIINLLLIVGCKRGALRTAAMMARMALLQRLDEAQTPWRPLGGACPSGQRCPISDKH